MIIHPIIKLGNILRFESKDGDGDMGNNMIIFIIVSLAPPQLLVFLLVLLMAWTGVTGVMAVDTIHLCSKGEVLGSNGKEGRGVDKPNWLGSMTLNE